MVSHKIPFWMLLVVEACSAMKESMVNLSCHSLETVDGNFKYPIDGNVIEFDISLQDKTKIGLWIKNESLKFDKKWVKAMDNTSFTLHQCHNLTLYKLYPKNEEETMYYHMAADEKTPAEQHEIPPWAIGVIVCTLALVVGLLVWCCRKNRILDRIWNGPYPSIVQKFVPMHN